jgi:hypothetical protein
MSSKYFIQNRLPGNRRFLKANSNPSPSPRWQKLKLRVEGQAFQLMVSVWLALNNCSECRSIDDPFSNDSGSLEKSIYCRGLTPSIEQI